ncbi:hypothetical protein LC593_12245 [Nostoc sp. CHAB 5844]|nr:hypothetical protein [Nostoc sp. CHAB 5844]
MTNPEEKLYEFLQKLPKFLQLFQRLNEATEANEQHLNEEIEKTLRDMRTDINDGNALFARQQEIDEAEFLALQYLLCLINN